MAENRQKPPKTTSEVDPTRRRFLLAGAGGAVGVSAVALAADAEPEAPAEQIKGRYRLTPHVERFYFLNRL